MTVSLTPDGNGGGGGGGDDTNGAGSAAGNGNGGGTVNNNSGAGGRRVLAAKTENVNANLNVNNNNNNNNNNVINNNNNIYAASPFSVTAAGKVAVLAVRRVLFGPPADPAETRAWLDRQLCAAAAADSKSWNFDFVNERPMRDSPADRYAWERVCPPHRGPKQQKRRGAADADDSADDAESPKRRAVHRQSKVTDYMGKTKKRPLAAATDAAAEPPLSNNKITATADGDEESAGQNNKRARLSVAM